MAHEMTQAEMEATGARFIEFIERLADTYETAVKAGMPQPQAYEMTRDKLAAGLKIPLAQAANLTRVVIAFVGKRYGEQVYKPEDFRAILGRAFGAPTAN